MQGQGFKGAIADGLHRHVAAATALRLPGPYTKLFLAGAAIGFVPPGTVPLLRQAGATEAAGAATLPNTAALARAEAALAQAGLFRPRAEAFDVRATPGGPVLAQIDRGALPCLGITAEGVHVNGLVCDGSTWLLWVAHRSSRKALDPGKLDHIVAGGISAGMDAAGTLMKEAAEEAGMPADLARQARYASTISYAIARPEGLRRDRLYCYDLELPARFTPRPTDGEVDHFELMPLAAALQRAASTDDFKFNVNLVLADLAARCAEKGPGALALDR